MGRKHVCGSGKGDLQPHRRATEHSHESGKAQGERETPATFDAHLCADEWHSRFVSTGDMQDMHAAARDRIEQEKQWLLSKIGLIPDHDDGTCRIRLTGWNRIHV